MTYWDRDAGEQKNAEVFVAILGASELTYVEASESQEKEQFIRSTERAIIYFGGVPRSLVPDNLKSAVTKASKYEPELNPLFDDFAEYYRTVILPARVYHPKDKALVENAVKLTYQRIFAPLYKRKFYSLDELNEAIREQLEQHNNRKLTKLQISRRQLFEEIEKNELKTLPSSPYPLKHFEHRKVAPDYHVLLSADKHYYSVPWRLKGQQVRLIYDERNVAIYAAGQRVAQHRRDTRKGGYTTTEVHMPAHHQFYASWSAEKFTGWAASIGEETHLVISHLLETKQHKEQAYKSCVGILSLANKYSAEELNIACRRAWNYSRISYREVKAYLEDLRLQRTLNREDKQLKMFVHENLRDSAIYR
jgi:transposase